jgi:predicted ATPase with chaperone activity
MTLVADLLLRRVQMDGTSSLQGLVEALKLSHGIVETVFKHLRQQKLLDVRGMIGEDYLFGLTSAGQKLANDRKKACRYAGPAPISVQEYQRSVRAQAAKVRLNRAILAEALGDLVMAEDLLQQLGPALVSQKSLFLYGPTGNGKTSVAERLQRIYHDFVFLPYAIEVDGQIIVIYDPVVHERVEIEEQHDPRFVPCRRPFIVVGGELTPAMLELRLDPVSQIYSAPLQMKANNGILVIDDFGRQMISPRKLLNRWIVPLDRRVDYLTLGYGVKFQIPFELMVIFSTNLDPLQLADEAFLRRIHNKVYVGAVDAAVFDEIFDRVLQERAVAAPANAAALVRELLYRSGCSELRACYPADICMIAQWITTFEERRSEFTELDLERAVALYFTRRGLDQQTVPSYE